MTAVVLVLVLRPGAGRDRVSDAIAREADRLGVASTELLAASARELAELRRRVRVDARVRERPAERAARARGVVEAVGRAR